MDIIRTPDIQALRDIAALRRPVQFRYGSSKRLVAVEVAHADAILAVYDRTHDPIQRGKIERMVARSDTDFNRVLAFCTPGGDTTLRMPLAERERVDADAAARALADHFNRRP